MKVGQFWLVVPLQPSGKVLKRVAHVKPKAIIPPFYKVNSVILGITLDFVGGWTDIG